MDHSSGDPWDFATMIVYEEKRLQIVRQIWLVPVKEESLLFSVKFLYGISFVSRIYDADSSGICSLQCASGICTVFV